MIAYDLHPEARLDLDEIWEFIRGDNLGAADRLIAEIPDALDALAPVPGRGHRRPDITWRHCASFWFVNTRLPTRRRKSRCGLPR
jgi:plasmid stabilization system protein ParE